MKKNKFYIIILLFTIHCSLFTASAQSWQALLDSAKYYDSMQDFDSAIVWCEKALAVAEKEFGTNDTNYAVTLQLLAELNNSSFNIVKAFELQKKSTAIMQNIFKSDHPKLAESIGNLGGMYGSVYNLNESDKLINEALDMLTRLKMQDSEVYAYNQINLSLICLLKSNFKKAESLLVESMSTIKKLEKDLSPGFAYAVNALGKYYLLVGNYNKADTLLKESVRLYRQATKVVNARLFTLIHDIAMLYSTMGKMHLAEPYFKEAVTIQKKIIREENAVFATFLNNVATFYLKIGDYNEAEIMFLDALRVVKNLKEPSKSVIAGILTNLGMIYSDKGQFKDVEYCMEEALRLNKEVHTGDALEVALSLNNAAAIFVNIGDYDKALKYETEALEMYQRIYKDGHLSVAQCMNNLGSIYAKMNNFGEAKKILLQCQEQFLKINMTENIEYIYFLCNLSGACFYLDDIRTSDSLSREALNIASRSLSGDYRIISMLKSNIGYSKCLKGDYEGAEVSLKEAIEITKRLYSNDNPDFVRDINALAWMYSIQNKNADAEPLFINALEIDKKLLLNYFPSLSEKEKGQFWSTMKSHFEMFNSFAIRRMIDNPAILGNMYDYLIFTKAILFNSSNKIKRRILASNDTVLISMFNLLTRQKENLVKYFAMTKSELAKQKINIDSLENIANELEKEISIKSEEYKQSYERKKVSWKTIQSLLKPDEAAIEIVRFDVYKNFNFTDTIYYAALIVTDQTTENPDIVLLENGKDLEEKYYNLYRKSVKKKIKEDDSFKNFWQKIYEKTKEYKKIYFSPDGIFNKINISTLKLPNGKYLIDEQEINTLNSTQDVILGYYSKQKETNIYNSAELFGNPDFGLPPDKVKESEKNASAQRKGTERNAEIDGGFELPSLPGTELEINNVAKFLKSKKWDVKTHTKNDAVKGAVKIVNNPRVLHIATHGLFLANTELNDKEIFGISSERYVLNPLLRSGLFFAGASKSIDKNFKPTGFDNGFLTAYEAMNLDLDKTELVVLSACETGLGEISNGEGVYSLQRAFQQAGAKTVMMSLWTVDDKATQELMSYFYEGWVSGKTKREAFTAAQLKIKEKYKEPYYWGAFVMVGE